MIILSNVLGEGGSRQTMYMYVCMYATQKINIKGKGGLYHTITPVLHVCAMSVYQAP